MYSLKPYLIEVFVRRCNCNCIYIVNINLLPRCFMYIYQPWTICITWQIVKRVWTNEFGKVKTHTCCCTYFDVNPIIWNATSAYTKYFKIHKVICWTNILCALIFTLNYYVFCNKIYSLKFPTFPPFLFISHD